MPTSRADTVILPSERSNATFRSDKSYPRSGQFHEECPLLLSLLVLPRRLRPAYAGAPVIMADKDLSYRAPSTGLGLA